MSDIIKTQRSLARKATHHRTHQFEDLYRLLCREEWIHAALNQVLSNQGARTAGIDGVTKKALVSTTSRDAFVLELQEELRLKRFRPVRVRRVYIPKSKDKLRPLGIPTLPWPSSTNAVEDGARTHLGKRISQLLQRFSPWTQNDG